MHNLSLALCVAALAGMAWAEEKVWNFDREQAGQSAEGFSNEQGQWTVVADESAPSKPNALAQTAANDKKDFNLTLINGTNYKNVDLSVQMKALAGKIDQGGGLVWRAKDAKNYYVARYNPLEDNYRVDKVVDGMRTRLENVDLKAAPGWHTLRVTMTDEHIECYFDGKKLLDVKDSTFADGGKIGLWTKADAQTHFDDLNAK